MLTALDDAKALTGNQRRIIAVAVIGCLLEYFDYFIIGFVMAFVVTPWKLSFGQSAVILLSSGLGACLGSILWGHFADRVGRRRVLGATTICFTLATGALALTPDRGWLYLAIFRLVVGLGVGGFFAVVIPLVQEFMPAAHRGRVAGFVTAAVSGGLILGALCAAFLTPLIGWRGLFALGAVPALILVPIRAWAPESPRWLLRQGRVEEARRVVGWALEIDPATLPTAALPAAQPPTRLSEVFRYPRPLLATWLSQIGFQTGANGVVLWAPTLLVLVLGAPAAMASILFVGVSVCGMAGRFLFAGLSERIGRRPAGILAGLGAAAALILAALFHAQSIAGIPAFWLLLWAWAVFGDGGYAVVGPYSSEVWPSRLRATGMGAAYGFGALGKIFGPLLLALVIGASNIISPQASVSAILPAFSLYAACYIVCAAAFLIGFETRGLSLAQIDAQETPPRAIAP